MPAPNNPEAHRLWIEKLSLSHKGVQTWNKGLKMSLSFKNKVSQNSKLWWNNPDNKEKIIERNKKVSLSKLGNLNPMKRPEVAKKVGLHMRKRMLTNENPMHNPKVRAKLSSKLMGHEVSKTVREKISKNLIGKLVGDKNPFWGKHHTKEVRMKSRARAINMITSGLLSNRRTGIEIAMKKHLEISGLDFKEQVPLLGITVVDFFLPKYNTIIYCDGDYWHHGEWAKKYHTIRNDKWKTKVIESKGYRVFRFSETQINKSCETCVGEVLKFINKINATST